MAKVYGPNGRLVAKILGSEWIWHLVGSKNGAKSFFTAVLREEKIEYQHIYIYTYISLMMIYDDVSRTLYFFDPSAMARHGEPCGETHARRTKGPSVSAPR